MVDRKAGAVRQGFWQNENTMCIEITGDWDHRAELDADDKFDEASKTATFLKAVGQFGTIVHVNSNTDFIFTIVIENFAFPRTSPSGGMAAGDITTLQNYVNAIMAEKFPGAPTTRDISVTIAGGGWYANGRTAGLNAGTGIIGQA